MHAPSSALLKVSHNGFFADSMMRHLLTSMDPIYVCMYGLYVCIYICRCKYVCMYVSMYVSMGQYGSSSSSSGSSGSSSSSSSSSSRRMTMMDLHCSSH